MRPTNRRPRNTKRLPAPCPLHEPPLSRPSATLSPPCGERAGRGVPIWFMAPMRVQILEVPPTHEPGGARLRRALIFAPNAVAKRLQIIALNSNQKLTGERPVPLA